MSESLRIEHHEIRPEMDARWLNFYEAILDARDSLKNLDDAMDKMPYEVEKVLSSNKVYPDRWMSRTQAAMHEYMGMVMDEMHMAHLLEDFAEEGQLENEKEG